MTHFPGKVGTRECYCYSYYPAYVGYGPYYDDGPWQAIQEPGAARFYRPYGYGWRPWGY